MPELPEVETIRRHLQDILPGRAVEEVLWLDARLVKNSALTAENMKEFMRGQRVAQILRRGKFLFVGFERSGHLLLHLGMSGRLTWDASDSPVRPHTHLILKFCPGHLRFSDPRRFGRIAWVSDGSPIGLGLGPEPLSKAFTGEDLKERLRGRTVSIKSALLNQSIVAGLGNIYADEALFRARIHPRRRAGSLSLVEVRSLVRAIRAVLVQSLEQRGTSFSDYVDALGRPGQNQDYLKVYGREGSACPRCKRTIARVVIGGRSSHYCPDCQSLKDRM